MKRNYQPPESRQVREPEPIGAFLWQAMPDGPEKYQAYLCSREWAEKRNAVYKRCGCMCERCRVNSASHVHHRTYIRKYNERLEDLQALCIGCHEFTHGKSDVDPRPKPREPQPLCYAVTGEAAWDGHSELCCPVPGCECPNVHLGKPKFIDGQDGYQAKWGGRGDLIAIPACCEWGHRWQMCFGFHKGTTFAFTRRHEEHDMSMELPDA